MKRQSTGLLMLLLLPIAAGAQPPESVWAPTECPDSDFAERLRMRAEAVRRATPGHAMYSAHPLPKTGQEAVEILLEYLSGRVERQGESVNMGEANANARAFLTLVNEGQVDFAFSTVAEWRPKLRCGGPVSYSRWFFMVRGFARQGGKEVFRGAVDEFGLPATWAVRAGSWEREPLRQIESLTSAVQRVETVVGRSMRDGQYVEATDSEGMYCSHLAPCVAMRDDRNYIYVTQAGDSQFSGGPRIVTIALDSAKVSEEELTSRRGLLANLAEGQTWVSLGGLYSLGEATSISENR